MPECPSPQTLAEADRQAVLAVRAGDTGRFAELVERHQARVFAVLRRHLRGGQEVEDVAQAVFLRAFQHLASWRGDAPFEHWLIRLAVRAAYDQLRQHQRRRERPLADLTHDEQAWLDRQAGPESGPAPAEGARALVRRILDQLPPASRLVITLLELEDRSVKEIAAL
ncbi:MAG: RNA polymerase sigma factor, partial [Verrucomicrobiota bacterium]